MGVDFIFDFDFLFSQKNEINGIGIGTGTGTGTKGPRIFFVRFFFLLFLFVCLFGFPLLLGPSPRLATPKGEKELEKKQEKEEKDG